MFALEVGKEMCLRVVHPNRWPYRCEEEEEDDEEDVEWHDLGRATLPVPIA